MSSRAKAHWAQAANEIVIEAWRYARHLGRTPAERIAIYNAEIQRLMHAGANAARQYARKRPFSHVGFAETASLQKPRKRP
jgi:hypothetical protein